MAEAQYRQALSGYWPQIDLKASIQRSDQPVNFLFPAQSVALPSGQIPVAGGTSLVTIPANAFAPGFPPANVQLPVTSPGMTVTTPAQTYVLPKQSVEVLDRDLAAGSLSGTFLVFDGGYRSALRAQAQAGVDAMKAEAKRSDLEVEATVRRLYWAAVLAANLRTLGNDVLSQMEITLRLTESHIKEATGKVNRTDYLYNQVIVDSTKSALVELEKNETLAEEALANTMGLSWRASVQPADRQLPEIAVADDVEQLVADTYRSSPDWAQLTAGIHAAEGSLKSAKSDFLPKFAIKGDLHSFWNGGLNMGLSTPQNRFGWTIGAGVEAPIFNGLRTQNKVRENLAKIRGLKESQLLLRDGLGLEVKSLLVQLQSAEKIVQTTGDAQKAADENRDLNMRAYESDMAEPDKVIQSQVIAALMAAQHLKARYDSLALGSQLGAVIGHEVIGHGVSGRTAPVQPVQP